MEISVPLPFLGFYAVTFWASYVWALIISERGVVRRSKKTKPQNQTERNTKELNWVVGVTLSAQFVAVGVAFWPTGRASVAFQLPMFWLGIVFLLAGSALRQHCFRMLGGNFTIDVRASEDQPIIESGAYAHVRHPSYLAAILMLTGVGVSMGSLVSAFILLSTAVMVYAKRITFEEQELKRTLGENYESYAAGRKKLFPYVY